MTIPRNQFERFLQTLKGYTEKCVAAKCAAVEKVEEAKNVLIALD